MAKIPILTLDADMPEVISGVVHFGFSFGDPVQASVSNPCFPLWLVLDAIQEGESRAGILILLLKHPARLLGTNLLALSTNRCFHAEG